MKDRELKHQVYHRILIEFLFENISDKTLGTFARDYGAKNFGKKDNLYFFDFAEHPARFLEDLSLSGLVEDYYIEGEPFDFCI